MPAIHPHPTSLVTAAADDAHTDKLITAVADNAPTNKLDTNGLITTVESTDTTDGIIESSTEALSIISDDAPLMHESEISLIPTTVTLTTSPGTETLSSSNDIASTAEITNAIEPNPTHSANSESGSGMGFIDVSTLANATDITDSLRNSRNIDTFPGELAILLHNNPVENIAKFKLDINRFADELVNHQQHYGLSECLFEPLEKIGEAFRESYAQKGLNQIPVDRYIKYISDLKNASSITTLNCSDINNWSLSTTTETPLSSTELTTIDEFVNETVNLSNASTTATTEVYSSTFASTASTQYVADSTHTLNSSASTTTEITESTAASTTPINSFNVTLDSTDTIDNNSTMNNGKKPVSTGLFNSKLLSLGLISAFQGAIAGVTHAITGNIYNYYESKGSLTAWRKPAAQAGVILANATIATLPILLSTVEDESEQSNSLTKVLQSTAYSLSSSLILNSLNYAARRAYAYFNTTPMNKNSIASKALDALPLLANTSLLINSGYNLTDAAVIVGSNTVAAGLSNAVTQSGMNYFFNSKKNNNADAEKGLEQINIELDEINIDGQFRNILSQVYQVDNETTSNFFIKLDAYFKQQDAIGKPVNLNGFYLTNLKQINEEDPVKAEWAYNYLISEKRLVPASNQFQISSVIPLSINKIENWDELPLMNKYARAYNNKISFPSTLIIQLNRLIATFIYGFSLQTKDFQVSSTTVKNFKSRSGELAPPIDMLSISDLGRNPLSIFQPIQIEENSAKTFPIYEMIETLISSESKKNNASNQIASQKLFPICTETSIAIIEILQLNSPKPKNTIAVHDPEHLLKKDLRKITDMAKKHGYSFKNNPDKNYPDFSGPLGAYYFIKNVVKNYREKHLLTNMQPNNEYPNLLNNLSRTMLGGLNTKITDLEFTENKLYVSKVTISKKIEKSEDLGNQTNNAAIGPSDKEQLMFEQPKNKDAILHEKMMMEKESINYLSSNSKNNTIISIFPTTLFRERGDGHSLSTLEVLNYLLSKRQSGIEDLDTPQFFKDLLILNDKQGIAIVEMISSKNSSKQLLIHDPNHVLENVYDQIFIYPKNQGYICKYNPNKAYSSYWNNKETSQLGAYFFIKNYLHDFFSIAPIILPPELKNYSEIRNILLAEFTNNLNLIDKTELDSRLEINITKNEKFDLKSYIEKINIIYQIPDIKIFSQSSSKTVPYQIILDEIKHNLGIKNNIKFTGDFNLEITTCGAGVNFEWSKLFSSKSIPVNEKNNQTIHVLFKGIETEQNHEAVIVRFLVSFHSKLLVLKNSNELKARRDAEDRTRRGTRYEKAQNQLSEQSKDKKPKTIYELVNEFLDTNETVHLNNLVDLFSKLKSTEKDPQETEIYDEYHKLLLKTFSLTLPDQLELFSEAAAITETNQETKLYSNDLHANFFSKPNSTAVAPAPQNHLTRAYK